MSDPHSPQILDHEYDGIQEFDNPTPGWWHAIFASTILFGVVYAFIAQFSPAYSSPEAAHAAASARALQALFGSADDLMPDENTLLTLMDQGDGKMLQYAKSKYATNCASCHGPKAEGFVGPNLTDDHWKNVTVVTDIYDVITDGAAQLAMPAQKNSMRYNDRIAVAAYIASLRGTFAQGGKPAEGDQIAPWGQASPPETPAEQTQPENEPGG